MCIRDSSESASLGHGLVAVSYTHLDVYKRQQLTTLVRGGGEFMRWVGAYDCSGNTVGPIIK